MAEVRFECSIEVLCDIQVITKHRENRRLYDTARVIRTEADQEVVQEAEMKLGRAEGSGSLIR